MKSRFSLRFPIVAAVCLLFAVSSLTFSAPVGTTTIDFSNYTDNGPAGPGTYEVFSNGFAFFPASTVNDSCGVPCLVAGPSHGESMLSMFPYSAQAPTNPNGATFSLISFAAAEPALNIPGRGIGAQWLTVEAVGTPTPQSYTFQLTDQLAMFDVNFSNVTEIQFFPFYIFPDQLQSVGTLDVTDLVVTQPSPEPASLLSSIVGFGFLGLIAAALHRHSRVRKCKALPAER